MIDHTENIYLNQKRNSKLFSKDYVGDQLLSPNISWDRMKTYYPTQRIDLRYHVVYVTPKYKRLFDEYDENPTNITLYDILIKHREP